MKIINSKGPKTDPWGTPLSTLGQSEQHSFRTVLCFLSVNKESVHFNKLSLFPNDSILASNLLCGTLSNALLKSRYRMSTEIPLSKNLVIFSRNSKRLIAHDFINMNPCLEEFKKTLPQQIVHHVVFHYRFRVFTGNETGL